MSVSESLPIRYSRRHPKIAGTVFLSLVVALILTWAGLTALSAARSARVEVRGMIDDASVLTVEQLLFPSTYEDLAERASDAHQAAARTRSRLGLFRPFVFIPVAGGRMREVLDTAEVAEQLSGALTTVFTAYAEAVRAYRVDDGTLVDVLTESTEQLHEAQRELDAAVELADRPLVLSDREIAQVRVAIGVLRSLTLVAISEPSAVADGLALARAALDVRDLAADPAQALADIEPAQALIATVEVLAADLATKLGEIVKGDDIPQELQLALDGVAMVDSLADGASALFGLADAVELVLFSEEFGVAVGQSLLAASDSFADADGMLTALEDSFATGLGDTLADAGAIEIGSTGVLAPARRLISDAASATTALRSLLGYDREKRYLVVLQNQNEVRATGGFIGATVEVPVSSGVLGELVFDDSTLIDAPPLVNNPPAPEPLFWYLWMGRLLFRDANWNPDFPTSASTLANLYEETRPVEFDGVFSGTKLLALDIVDVLGTVRVPGVDGPLDRAAAARYVEGELTYRCRSDHVSQRGKRCFDEDLLSALMDGLRLDLSASSRAEFIEVIRQHLRGKDVQVFMHDAEIQELILRSGWGGKVPSPAQDLLMVIDSSFPGHMTASIARTWDYRMRLVPGGTSEGSLLLRFENGRAADGAVCRQADPNGGGCYWNYVRVFLSPKAMNVQVPSAPLHEGSEKLTWGHRDLETTSVITHAAAGLAGLVEVGAYVVVEPESTLTLPVRYDLSSSVLRELGGNQFEYRLQLVKQSGIANDRIRVRFELPLGAKVVASSPEGFAVLADDVRWEGGLTEDTQVVLRFRVN